METLPDWVPVLPVETYLNPIPEENATRLSTSYYIAKRWVSAGKHWVAIGQRWVFQVKTEFL